MRVEAFEVVQGIVQSSKLRVSCGRDVESLVEFDGDLEAAAFVAVFGARMVHQDAANGLRGDGIEVGAVFPRDALLIDQAKEGFVDEGGALEGVPGTLPAQLLGGDAEEFGVNDGNQLVEGGAVAFAPAQEERCEVVVAVGHGSESIARACDGSQRVIERAQSGGELLCADVAPGGEA